jgi:hypothetical protein
MQMEPAIHVQLMNYCKMENAIAKKDTLEMDALVNSNAILINLFTGENVPLVHLTLFIENKSMVVVAQLVTT